MQGRHHKRNLQSSLPSLKLRYHTKTTNTHYLYQPKNTKMGTNKNNPIQRQRHTNRHKQLPRSGNTSGHTQIVRNNHLQRSLKLGRRQQPITERAEWIQIRTQYYDSYWTINKPYKQRLINTHSPSTSSTLLNYQSA